jgi:hypothetical protein
VGKIQAVNPLTGGRLVTQVGTPVQGEVLASRYRLDELLRTDPSVGHALWRGTDSLLNRAVAIELRVPGGRAAEGMISAAVTAGRIVHPCVVGVYDAVDEGERAFVVREWVEGTTLAGAVREGPLSPHRAAVIARTAADALAAIHAAGYVHGNVQPRTVLLGQDDEITLTDLRLDPSVGQQQDIRAIGGLLYASLTGHWPHSLSPYDPGLPDALHVDGRMLSPRQVRAGIPGYLDALTMDLLDHTVATPPAAELAAELRRYDVADPELSPLGTIHPEPAGRRSPWKRVAVGVGGIAAVLVTALVVAANGLGGSPGKEIPNSDDPTQAKPGSPSSSTTPLQLVGVEILDPPKGDGAEKVDEQNAIDGDPSTEWRTAEYKNPAFGQLKPGMGVVVDLGEQKKIGRVTVDLDAAGATVSLRAGNDAPQDDPSRFTEVAGTEQANAPETVTFTIAEELKAQYVMVWITFLPEYAKKPGKYALGVQEIKVTG